MVMTTGIIAIALHLHGISLLPSILTTLNAAFFVVLALMTIARAILYPAAVFHDMIDHTRGLDFLTAVAGACMLGAQFVSIAGQHSEALARWILALVLWTGLNYAIFAGFALKRSKPSLGHGINSGWLIAVVATEALAQLSLLLLPQFGDRREDIVFFALTLWLAGGMLYIWIVSLIFYRYTFFHLEARDLLPPYWIDMGAMAIAALVGTTLVRNGADPLLAQMIPFIKGFTILFWATATWWIPMLAIFAFWRHGVARQSFAYSPFNWAAIFPLGMYAVMTFRLSEITGFVFLFWISKVFTWIALAAWLAAFAGLLRTLAKYFN